ncbi:hypothetical protein NNJEOMEG_03604 [Fundidesulfovibrio magnetotacticus]|uniref:Outer membrane protein n=1 Tax=Fundidesulfovibrio magnetotacticus TaxID=2730080 RepID=A0A6V8M1A5_9BACT|nr:TolC family protein [Fundidesulfovibrio magnetotacticus]GFK95736.1 hypothetical protein NNJEOMEG_03604 [Fundidesulfovibrio magnetotacticus]
MRLARRPNFRLTALCLAALIMLFAAPALAAKDKSNSAEKPDKIRSYETLPTAPPAPDKPVQPMDAGQAQQPGDAKHAKQAQPAVPAKPAAQTQAQPPAQAQAKSGLPGSEPLPSGAMPANGERPMSTSIKQPADFHECVRVALVQSPLLVRSALEIETKRLDVQDAWSTFVPTVSINTTYWFRMPTKIDGTQDKPYTISFSTGQWNPVLSTFEVQARNEMANIAVLGHLKVISAGLVRLATDFIQLEAVESQRAVSKDRLELAQKNLTFYKTRLGIGQATQLEIKLAETRIDIAKAELEQIESIRNSVMDDIKFILGVPFTNKLELDVAAARKQIMGAFTIADVTDEKIRANSFDLRMAEYERRLQKKNIGLSYVKLLPSFGFTFQTVDSLNSSTTYKNEGFPFYPGINISMPLDYWTKGREISRQYKKLEQTNAQNKAKEFELIVSVQKALSDYQTAASELRMSTATVEFHRLRDEQSEYQFKSGQTDFDKLVDSRSLLYDNKQKMLLAQSKRDIALLTLMGLSGDLRQKYVDIESWEK